MTETTAAATEVVGQIRCYGCGGLVPDVTWPVHRYFGASPGCWAIYTEVVGGGLLGPIPPPHGALLVDAYAAQHPGAPGPQSTPSVWIHLIALHLVLEGGWRADQSVQIRRFAADSFQDWSWLEPPLTTGEITVADLDDASDGPVEDLARRWVEGVWAAWAVHHEAVRVRAAALVAALE
jgi:hypothetical protein